MTITKRRKLPESDHLYEYGVDLPRNRVYLTGDIDLQNTVKVIQGMSMLARQSTDTPIQLVINSEGGDMVQAFSLIDYMNSIPNPINGIVLGNCQSAAVVILQACQHRAAGSNSVFMTHRGSRDSKIDLLIDTRADKLIADRLGWTLSRLDKFHSHDRYLTAQEALEMKLLDELMWNKK